MPTAKKKGDEAEQFVALKMKEKYPLVEVHPRTFRIIYIKGRQIQVSRDNDYHNLFDNKAEGPQGMLYAQVKVEDEKANVSKAQKDIDRDYPYEFPYQKIQTWQVWKEWVKEPHRHKEFRFRIQERQGFTDKFWGQAFTDDEFWGKSGIRKGNWVDVEW